MSQNKICQFYLMGKCKFGNKCKNLHTYDVQMNQEISPISPISQIQPKSTTTTCHFFLDNKCTKGSNCPYFHGYCDRLEYLKSIENHQSNITNLVIMDNIKYISSDERSFHIRFSGINNEHGQNIAQDYTIGKLIYSSDKLIMSIKTGSM
jgi:hypothetical protein